MQLLEQPPKGLHVLVVVSYVWIVEVNEVSHLLRQATPLGSKLHDIIAALVVIVLYGDVFVGLLVVDVSLGYPKLLFNAKLNGQSVCVPPGLAMNLVALHGLVSVEGIFD